MANEVLKEIFQELHYDIVNGINPDSGSDVLFSKKIISHDDYSRLRQTPVIEDRCRDLMSRLHQSPHRQAFIHLRLALLEDYPWLVEEIDERLPSLTSQLQQLHLSQSTDGKFLLLAEPRRRPKITKHIGLNNMDIL